MINFGIFRPKFCWNFRDATLVFQGIQLRAQWPCRLERNQVSRMLKALVLKIRTSSKGTPIHASAYTESSHLEIHRQTRLKPPHFDSHQQLKIKFKIVEENGQVILTQNWRSHGNTKDTPFFMIFCHNYNDLSPIMIGTTRIFHSKGGIFSVTVGY